MKKILSVVLALVLVCGLAVTAMAASVSVSIDPKVIEAGDTVTVTLTLDETITAEAGTTSVQTVLSYDWDVLEYVSGTPGDGYASWLAIASSKRNAEIKINSGTDFTVKELPAGTIAVVTFKALETTSVQNLSLGYTFATANASGTPLENVAVSTDLIVCTDHNVVETVVESTSCMEGGYITKSCETCGYEEVTELPALDHTLVHVDAVEPGCHYEGNIEHWYCTVCGTVWADEALTQITNHMSVILPATGEGNVVHMDAVEPGCHYDGNIEYWICYDCEQVWQDEALTQLTNIKNVVLPAVGGEVVHVEAVAPSCYEEGNIEYWYCEKCEQVWQNEALTQLTNFKNVILPATHQNVIHVEAVAPTCYEDGNIEYWYCEDCQTVWADEALTQITNFKNVVVPAVSAHNLVHMEAVEPGCHYEGNIEYWYCTICDTVWQDAALTQITNHKNVILPALGGEVVHVEAVDATCTKDGNIEHWYCEECEQVWQNEALTQLTNFKNVIVGATGHVDADKNDVCDICGADLSNPKDGDTEIVAISAIALVSLMAIVALPVAKKKLF